MSEHSECVVVDVTDFDQWPTHYGSTVIAVGKRPTVIQPDRETAEREAVRLAQANPGHRFAVFTFAGVVETTTVPTHITLGGKVVSTTTKPVWTELGP